MKPVPELKQNKGQSENCLKHYSMLIYTANLSVTCFYSLQFMSNLQSDPFFYWGSKQEFCMPYHHQINCPKISGKEYESCAPQYAFLSRAQSSFLRSKSHLQILILTCNVYFLIFRAEVTLVDCVWNVMAHVQEPDFLFWQNRRVHLNWRGRQFSWLLAAEVCASAVVMLDTPCSVVVWRVLATRSIRQFPLHFPSRASPCAITFQLESN
jgi:hypothetical protein